MAVHRRYDIMALVAIAIAVVAYASLRSEYRLRPTMPVEFFDPANVPARQRAAEELVAKAYWNCAVTQIQWKYGYAHRLPEEPPPEFSIAPANAGAAGNTSATRAHYWQKLREVWGISSVWQRQYGWDTISLRNSVHSAGDWLEGVMRRITGYS